MTKDKRDRLFGKQRPNIRPLQIMDGDKYHKDMGLLWVSYSKGKFFVDFPKELDQSQFAEEMLRLCSGIEYYIVEDNNSEYNGFGPIAVISVTSDGWKVYPHTVIFPWATTRNKLRGCVAFFQMVRYKKIGVVLVESLSDSKALFDRCQQYGVLHYVGKVPGGDPRGDEFLYTIRGKK